MQYDPKYVGDQGSGRTKSTLGSGYGEDKNQVGDISLQTKSHAALGNLSEQVGDVGNTSVLSLWQQNV